MNNLRYFSFIILSIAFQSLSGIFGKYAALSLLAPTLTGIFTNIFYLLSLGCLFFQAIVWQQALRHFPLSIAYPCISLTNYVVLFFSAILFQEKIVLPNIFGLAIITIGIIVLFTEVEVKS
jgi:multidrug transporter EmrE-like cation transporter